MRITIGTVDGRTHESVEVSYEEIKDDLPESGYVGMGPGGAPLYVSSEEDLIEFLDDYLKYDKSNDNQLFSMETIENPGHKRRFNVQHIVWWDIV